MFRYSCMMLSIFLGVLNAAQADTQLEHSVNWPTHLKAAKDSQLFCNFEAAYTDALAHNKRSILVFFSHHSTTKFDSLIGDSFSLPPLVGNNLNVVVMMPGLISPLDFFLKLDPVIIYMSDFAFIFPEIENYKDPCLCYIFINEEGQPECTAIHRV
ncbi:hypothetical protein [Candidatus Chlamydia sanziniae]|uniref:Uncharacterized protein n=1 Tax=Candidatus Chlamydia sanziniae TaxID=1806891 RepID=A0A1A9HVL2_9CHLA|nr:hypothetical protein [Candidatus Chlamydia sanziniae]ANH78737.1 hypothetical protein Cs308_0567 [Candidatus Chlamydia sanziniae]